MRLCFLVLGALLTCLGYAQQYSREVLFTLTVGAEAQHLGIAIPTEAQILEGAGYEGPAALAVGPNGTLYIADTVNRCVKVFDTRGKLVLRTAGELPGIGRIAVDRTGQCYVLGGEMLDTLAAYGPDGVQRWRVKLAEVLPAYQGGVRDLCLTGAGVAILAEKTLFLLTPAGTFDRTLPEGVCTEAGRRYTLIPVPGKRWAFQVGVQALEDVTIDEYPVELTGQPLRLFIGSERGTLRFRVRPDGSLDLIAYAARPTPITLSPELRISSDLLLAHFDEDGELVGALRLPGAPFITGQEIATDRTGALYHLECQPGAIAVAKYTWHAQ